ncbi:HAD family hydrolase [Furfurilactobacillus siliginis]|uniref:Cof family hydrolase n=1 Tax=Furfurilactobacillus siliginis TaxID=348151 RepID=A0A0R2L5I1_9LACO|nr:HAD family hydrolase [Furfurilactobacillus siliginis]KRN93860.1 cof family hydrolase [Furfurilactobacillus siliginis]GEK29059.1 haloacid dehalogenase [Furfurilactobacillus siliginis]
MERHLIVTDIDGTLIPSSQKVSPFTKQILRQLRDDGHEVFIASGRLLALAESIADQVMPKMNIICANGAVTRADGNLSVTRLGEKAVMTLYDSIVQSPVTMRLFSLDTTFHNSTDPDTLAHMAFLRQGVDTPTIYLGSREATAAVADQVVNGLVVSDDPNALAAVFDRLEATGMFSLSSSNPHNIEVIPKGISKATALQKVQQDLEIDAAHTLVFGNGLNDVPMFANGTGVAMADAPQAVIDAAKTTTNPVTEDGVPKYLANYFKFPKTGANND